MPKKPEFFAPKIILLDKPQGLSSNQALQKIKYLMRADKAGHTGTLDPLATGMLPICLNGATRLAEYLLLEKKGYEVTIQLGQKTNTGDAEGEVILHKPIPELNPNQLQNTCNLLMGKAKQIPPMYSALKQNGKPLYELAREGVVVERAARDIEIFDFTFISYDQNLQQARFAVSCSSGTYIRTLMEDYAEKIGTCAYVLALRRTFVGNFLPENMLSLNQITGNINNKKLDFLLDIDQVLDFPKIIIDNPEDLVKIKNGNFIYQKLAINHPLILLYEAPNIFLGVAEYKDGKISPKKMMKN